MCTLATALCLVLILAAPIPAAADEGLDGYWIDEHSEVVMQVQPCGKERCAQVVWLQKPFGPDGKALRDFRNSDPALQSRLVCGMTVVSGFKKQPDGTWGDGTVYVPDLGSSFSGYAEVLSRTQVKVRGYVLIPLFGMSEVWTRVAPPEKVCEHNPTIEQTAGPESQPARPEQAQR